MSMDEEMYSEIAEPSFGDYLLTMLLSCKSQKMQRRLLYDRAYARYKKRESTFRSTLSRLHKAGYIRYNRETVMLADKLFVQKHLLPILHRPNVDKTKQLVVMFDIPENIRGVRYWLRTQLKLWGFTKMQQSVWVGYGPLPKEFTSEIRDRKLSRYIKIMEMNNVRLLKI